MAGCPTWATERSANGAFLDRYAARLPELLEPEVAVEPDQSDDAEQPAEPVPTLGPGS